MWIQSRDFTAAQLDRFTELQRAVYRVLETVAETLRPDVTEREVARRIHRTLRTELGMNSYFHVPVALFGERTAYPGRFGQLEALPTERRLRAGEVAILDCAPIIDGYTIDCSMAWSPPHSPAAPIFAEADQLLRRLRALILERARGDGAQRGNMRDIAREVDRTISEAGFENCHRKHIGAVLGHRVMRSASPRLDRARVWGIGVIPAAWFLATTAWANRKHPASSPNWNHTRHCNAPLQPGLWAVEPHVARDGIGVKFEELLLVAADDVRFLDDDLAHTRRWQRASAA
jgi:Xaa-Pro aminopeptidase